MGGPEREEGSVPTLPQWQTPHQMARPPLRPGRPQVTGFGASKVFVFAGVASFLVHREMVLRMVKCNNGYFRFI